MFIKMSKAIILWDCWFSRIPRNNNSQGASLVVIFAQYKQKQLVKRVRNDEI